MQLGPPGEEEFIASSIIDEEREQERRRARSEEATHGGSLQIEGEQQDGTGQVAEQQQPSLQPGTVVEGDLISID